MHEIETWAPGSAACALCVINISSHETGLPAGRGGGGPGPMGPPLDPPLHCMHSYYYIECYKNSSRDLVDWSIDIVP